MAIGYMSEEEYNKLIQNLMNIPRSSSFSFYPSLMNNGEFSKGLPMETDEQGNIYGYKVLLWNKGYGVFVSPMFKAEWKNGILEADVSPDESDIHGIYFLKDPYDQELNYYYQRYEHETAYNYRYGISYSSCFIVHCIISGGIVEAERGFRSQYAKIEGVLNNGNWQTYQDFQNEAEYYARQREEPWLTRDEARYITGYDWDTLPPMASPNQDPTEG